MKLREHRRFLHESMATVIEIEPTLAALIAAVREGLKGWHEFKDHSVHVEPYCYDERIGWDCHIVVVDGWGVYGFTDGPVK